MVMNHDNIKHEWVNGDQVHLMQIFSNLHKIQSGGALSRRMVNEEVM